MPVTEGERLARMEEQILGMREDVSEMRTTVTAFITQQAELTKSLPVDYVPRREVDQREAVLTKEIADLQTDVDDLDTRLQKVEKEVESRPSWFMAIMLTSISTVATGLIVGLGVYVLTKH
jgi:predicted RNase H-like nuclease (RuvC/YqgF family)